MGYDIVIGQCVGCSTIISFNSNKVPSIRIRWENGKALPDANREREPLCRRCAETLHANLRAQGQTPPEIAPEAYDGCAEEELPL